MYRCTAYTWCRSHNKIFVLNHSRKSFKLCIWSMKYKDTSRKRLLKIPVLYLIIFCTQVSSRLLCMRPHLIRYYNGMMISMFLISTNHTWQYFPPIRYYNSMMISMVLISVVVIAANAPRMEVILIAQVWNPFPG